MQAFIDRFRYKATRARQAQSRLKALEKIAAPPPPLAEAPVRLHFPEPRPLAPPLLDLQGVAVGYDPGHPVLRGLDLRLDMGDRVALLGANGNGKTTLLRLLAERLRPSAGALRRAPRLAVGYFAQDRAESLDPAASAERHIAAAWTRPTKPPGAPIAGVSASRERSPTAPRRRCPAARPCAWSSR